MHINHIVFVGKNKKPASIYFGKGLNVIVGPSNSGKSFVSRVIDYMLGGETLVVPREGKGYEHVLMGVTLSSGKERTLIRSVSGGDFFLSDGLTEVMPDAKSCTKLGAKHAKNKKETVSKQLVINSEEAELVKLIFEKYIELGCVRRLREYLDFQGIKTKNWKSRRGRTHGSASFSRGILYKILGNPVYIGKTRHKDKIYEGQHTALLSEDIWNRVQEILSVATVSTRSRPAVSGNILKGKLFDHEGNYYSPVFTSRGAKQYRYYTSQAPLQGRSVPNGIVGRIPAQDIETLVENTIRQNLPDIDAPEIKRVTIHPRQLKIAVADTELTALFEPIQSGRSFVIPNNAPIRDPLDLPAPQLKALVKGTIWRGEYFAGMSMQDIAKRENTHERYVRHLITNSLTII